MSMESPITDIWGWTVAIGLSGLLAEGAFQKGRLGYKTFFFFCGGNLLISLAAFSSGGGAIGGGWIEVFGIFIVSCAAYFAYLGFSVTFRHPKNVKCFRCHYVSYPSETDEPLSKHNEQTWREFRRLNAEAEKNEGELLR